MLENLKQETENGRVWHENRVHHLLNKSKNNYDNYLVHTSKLYNIYKVNISAQFWILNELINDVDLVFSESGFTFDPITASSSMIEPTGPELRETATVQKNSSLVDEVSFSKYSLDDMLSFYDFKGLTKKEKALVISKSKYISCFTGTPFDMNKSNFF